MTDRKPLRISTALLAGGILVLATMQIRAATTEELVETLKKVDRAGQGNVAAAQALQELAKQDADVLPVILEAF